MTKEKEERFIKAFLNNDYEEIKILSKEDLTLLNRRYDYDQLISQTNIAAYNASISNINNNYPILNYTSDFPVDISTRLLDINMVKCLIECGGKSSYNLPPNYSSNDLTKTIEIFKIIAHQGFYDGTDGVTLMTLARGDHSSKLEIMLKRGLDPNVRVYRLWSPLHYAAYDNKITNISLLLQYNANIDQVDVFHNTAIHTATANNCYEAVKLLLQNHASINIQNNTKGYTPLHLAAKRDRAEIVYLLKLYNADILIQDGKGRTAYELAKSEKVKNILKLDLSSNYTQFLTSKPINSQIINNGSNYLTYNPSTTVTNTSQTSNNLFLEQQIKQLERERRMHLEEIEELKKEIQLKDVTLEQLRKNKKNSEAKPAIKQSVSSNWRTQIDAQRKPRREPDVLNKDNVVRETRDVMKNEKQKTKGTLMLR